MSQKQLKLENKQFATLYNENSKIKKNEEMKKVELKVNPSNNSESEQLKERIEKIKNTEVKPDVSTWKPNSILCKRFKIKDPFENKINTVQSKDDNNNESITFRKGENNYSMSSLQYQLFKQETSKFANKNANSNANANTNNKTNDSIINNPIVPAIIESNNDIKISNNKKNVFEAMNSKVDMNLFDEIFGE